MSLDLTTSERVARARADLRVGAPVALLAEGAGALAVAAELATAERLTALGALGPLDLAVTARRAETLKARPYDGDLARIALETPVALDRLVAAIDPSKALARPFSGPFATRREGSAAPHRLALALCKQARLLPAAVVAPHADAARLAAERNLTVVSAADLAGAADAGRALRPVASAPVPLEVAEDSRVHVFRPGDGAEEHYAIEVGRPSRAGPPLARLHSACFTGDLIGSLKCDCGPQLRAALAQIGAAGEGVLLYLNQEGRGIGLANKLRAYALQGEGFDTVEANHRLGFEDEERDFRLGAAMLREMGFASVRLMTNNPGKVRAMEATGVRVVERVPLMVGLNPHNRNYLATKRAKSGHLL